MVSNSEPQSESNSSSQVNVFVNLGNQDSNAEQNSQEPAQKAPALAAENKEPSSPWGLAKVFYDDIKKLHPVYRFPVLTIVLILALAFALKKIGIPVGIPFPSYNPSPSIKTIADDRFSPGIMRLARGNVPVTVEQVQDLLSRWYQVEPEVFGRSSSHNSPRIENIAEELTVSSQDWENQPDTIQQELPNDEKLLYEKLVSLDGSVASLKRDRLYWEYLQPGRVRSVDIFEQTDLIISGSAVVVEERCLRNRYNNLFRGHEDNGKYEMVIEYKLLRTDGSLKIVYIRSIEAHLKSIQCY